MSSLISSTIPSLIGGVSQQPWNVRLPTQAEEQINCCSSVIDFMRRRPATQHISKLFSHDEYDAGTMAVHAIHRDAAERYVVSITNGNIHVFDLQGQRKTVDVSASGANYLSHAGSNAQPLFKFLTINDTTLVLNTGYEVAMSEETTPKRQHEAFVFIQQASYNTTYGITLNSVSHACTTADGLSYAGEPADSLSSVDIAASLRHSIIQNNEWLVDCVHSTLWIRRADGADFTLQAFDSRSNTHITSHRGTLQSFSKLPVHALNNSVVEITGDAGTSFDNYYVRFECESAGAILGKGVWRESVRPGIQWTFQADTLPHKLVRQADGTFTFEAIEWGGRDCGDEETAPNPSFVGKTISGMFFYRNRLAFLSEENVIMSRVGEFFEFFPSTVTALVDSDPVDIAVSHTRPSPLCHTAQFAGGVLLFTADAQFVLQHSDILSNATASLKPVTEFAVSPLAAPVSSGKTVFFTVNHGPYAAVREYLTLPDQSDQNDAADITAHVPRYICGNVQRLICSISEDALFAISQDAPSSIWMYKYFWNGTEKLQSAWSRWDMHGRVVDGFIIETTLYLLMEYADGVHLEALRLESGYCDAGASIEYRLDRKVTSQQLHVTYDEAEDTTSLVLPFTPTTEPVCVHTATGYVCQNVQWQGQTLIVRGDLRSTPVVVGLPFTSSYTFSTFSPRDEATNSAQLSGRLQLRSLTLACADTGVLHVEITPYSRPSSTHTFNARKLGHTSLTVGQSSLYTGIIRIPVLAQNTQARLRIWSDEITPFSIISATWEGFFHARNMRVS